jgi:RNA polymerase sigma-70 factor (ECF subfamily)
VRNPERLTAFVYGTARNVVNNHLRAGRQSRTEALPPDLVAATVSPADEFEAGRRRDLVRRALARLSHTDRHVLVLTLVDGLKPGEIADRLGLTSEAVRTRKTRALKKIIEKVTGLSLAGAGSA